MWKREREDTPAEARLSEMFPLPTGKSWQVGRSGLEIVNSDERRAPEDHEGDLASLSLDVARRAFVSDPHQFDTLSDALIGHVADKLRPYIESDLIMGVSVHEALAPLIPLALDMLKGGDANLGIYAESADFALRQFTLLSRLPLPDGWRFEFSRGEMVATDGENVYHCGSRRAAGTVADRLAIHSAPERWSTSPLSESYLDKAKTFLYSARVWGRMHGAGVSLHDILSLAEIIEFLPRAVPRDELEDAMMALTPYLGMSATTWNAVRDPEKALQRLAVVPVRFLDSRATVLGVSAPLRSAETQGAWDTFQELARLMDNPDFFPFHSDMRERHAKVAGSGSLNAAVTLLRESVLEEVTK